jgi:hypothetical protein
VNHCCRFQPTTEDAELFKLYQDRRDMLEPVDRFMLDLCNVPKLSLRIDLVLALWDLPNNYQALLEVGDLLGGVRGPRGEEDIDDDDE